MPSLTLTFPQKINESLQIGDTIYYSNDGSNIIKMGNVTAPLSSTQIQITVDTTLVLPTTNSFILFSKDTKLIYLV